MTGPTELSIPVPATQQHFARHKPHHGYKLEKQKQNTKTNGRMTVDDLALSSQCLLVQGGKGTSVTVGAFIAAQFRAES